jgi:hypothetical protein
MKDGLLDEYEVEIGNLKVNYQKFIAQNKQNHYEDISKDKKR